MTATRPTFLAMSGYVLAAALRFALAATPVLSVAAQVVA